MRTHAPIPVNPIPKMTIDIYTDGSCITETCTGAWVAILFIGQQKITLSGTEADTTHNRMELLAVIHAITHVQANYPSETHIRVYSDSQYVCDLTRRKAQLQNKQYTTNKGIDIRNSDLVKRLYQMQEGWTVEFIKVKAHQHKTEETNYNIEADKLVRKLVRATNTE